MSWLRQRWAALHRTCRESWEAGKGGLKRRYQKTRTAFGNFFGKARYKFTEKETFVVTVGTVEGPTDKRRAVVFEGQELAQRVWAEDERRVTETLYQIGHGRYLVHVRTLRRVRGLPTELELREAGEADLARDGDWAELGRLRPATFGEAS